MAAALADDVLVRMWLHGRPANTAAGYRRDIRDLLASTGKPIAEIGVAELQRWADDMAALAPATVRRKLAAAKSLLRYAAETGAIAANPGSALRLGGAAPAAAGRELLAEQVARLIGAETDPRRHALLRLLYVCGLRASEVCGLARRDLAPRPKGAGEAAVLGKGGKTRPVGVPADLWRELVALDPSARPDAPVIPGRNGLPINRKAVHRAVKAAGRRVGLPKISAHWLRHAHVSHALDRGAPVQVVQQTVGHADLRTTTRYAHVRPGASSSSYLSG